MGKESRISKNYYKYLLDLTKNLPYLIHIVIAVNYLEYFTGLNLTNMLYPIFGHSIMFDLLLLYMSYSFKFCSWHRILIFSMIYNISVEWVLVNIRLSHMAFSLMSTSAFVTVILLIISGILRKKAHGKFYQE